MVCRVRRFEFLPALSTRALLCPQDPAPVDSVDPHLAALHRLLADAAAHGGQSTLDALVALTYRSVFVAPWPAGIPGYRTLVNSQGMAALPVFTDRAQIVDAGERFGWRDPTGAIAAVEVPCVEALVHAKTSELAFVVVDITSEHSLEIARDAVDAVLEPSARKEPSGLIRLPTTRPMSAGGTSRPSAMASSTSLPRVSGSSPPAPSRPTSASALPPTPLSALVEHPTSAGGSSAPRAIEPTVDPTQGTLGVCLPSALLAAPAEVPADALLDELEAMLRGYPEVEWACIGTGPDGGRVLGLRVEARIRQRVQEIAGRASLAVAPATLPVVLLDDPAHMRHARQEALVFYPWRRR